MRTHHASDRYAVVGPESAKVGLKQLRRKRPCSELERGSPSLGSKADALYSKSSLVQAPYILS